MKIESFSEAVFVPISLQMARLNTSSSKLDQFFSRNFGIFGTVSILILTTEPLVPGALAYAQSARSKHLSAVQLEWNLRRQNTREISFSKLHVAT